MGEKLFSADIDPNTYLLDVEQVRKILVNDPSGNYVGIIPVDLAGRPVDLERFRELADEFGLWIIEDACHAPGGYFIDSNENKQYCGNGKFADLAIFSFHPVKHIAAGEGGMVTTNNQELYQRIMNLRTHGIQQNPAKKLADHGIWYYEMQELGFNYRLTDIQASLGISQLKRAEPGVERRRQIAQVYNQSFADKTYMIQQSGVVDGHAYHLYIIEVEDRKDLIRYLREKNVFCQVHYIPVHLMPYYQQFGWREGDFPNAERYYSRCLSIPMYPSLQNSDLEAVIELIDQFYLKGHYD